MPFTPTHIAAILPIAWILRWRVPLSALMVGSMVNDIGVFFPYLFDYRTMHTLPGLWTHCVPIGLVLYFIFHWLVKRPFCALLPFVFRSRLVPWSDQMPSLHPGSLAVIVACILIGAASHTFWDSFTHAGRWGVKQFPALNEIVIDYSQRPIRWYSILQHGSSLVFLPPMVIGACTWVLRQPSLEPSKVPSTSNAVRIAGTLFVLATPLACFFYYYLRYPGAPLYTVIHSMVILSGTIVIGVGLLYGIAYAIIARDSTLQRIAQRNT